MSGYSTAVLADSPIRYYRLDQTSGTSAIDSGSQSQNGTYTGGFTLNQTSLLTSDADACVKLNGTTGYISIPTTGLPSGAASWSIECWINLSVLSGDPVSINFGTTGSGTDVELYYHATANSWTVDLDGSTLCHGSTSASINTTYHVVATYDGTSLRLYVNGALDGGPTAITANLGTTYAVIGCYNSSSFFCTGFIDEVAIYSTALSATRILAHYNAGLATTNTFTAPAESVSLSEVLAFGGNPAVIDSVSLADLNTLAGKATIIESTPLGETTLLSGVPMPSESVSALEVTTSQLGSTQNTESTPISDQSNLSGITTIAAESVSVGEGTPALTGQPSPTDTVSLADLNALAGATTIASESASLSENNSQSGSIQSSDSAQLSEVPQLTNQSQIVEIVQLGEQYTLVGSTQITNSVTLAELLSMVGLTNVPFDSVLLSETVVAVSSPSGTTNFFTAPADSVSLSELVSMVGSAQTADSAQISDATALAGATVLPPDLVQLLEQISLTGKATIAPESVALSDSSTFASLQHAVFDPNTNVIVYVRGGNVEVFARDGSAVVSAREGNVTVYEE